jgi:ubiquinone biosynthesis protein UbiJ
MANNLIETSKIPQIEVDDCAGDLVIRPWMELAVKAQGTYQMDEIESRLVFSSNGDLRLLVPEGAILRVGNVQGDLLIKGVRGDISLNEISGDAVLLNLTQVKAGNIQGDLSAKNSEGPLYVEAIYGDAMVRNIDRDVSIDSIYGDFAAYYVSGNVNLGQCIGDINLRTINGEISIDSGHRDANLRNLGSLCSIQDIHGDIRFKGGLSTGEHSFEALGDIVARWPGNVPLQVVAKAADICNRLPLEDVKEIDNSLVGRIGDGDTIVKLSAGGRIILKEVQLIDEKWESKHKEEFDMDFMIDLADLGERISAEVNQSMARMTGEIETHFGPEFAQTISARVSQQAEKAARKAEAAAERARNYAEREMARAERAQQRRSVQYAPPPKRSPRPDVSHAKASTDEQLKILRMVEKGTISPDEASTLLEALER